jgi:hypothetical protein
MEVGRHDDPEPRTCLDIDMWIDAPLADDPKPRNLFKQRCPNFGSLAYQNKRLTVAQPLGFPGRRNPSMHIANGTTGSRSRRYVFSVRFTLSKRGELTRLCLGLVPCKQHVALLALLPGGLTL